MENWDHSTLDKVEIIHSSKNTVQCSVEFKKEIRIKKVMQKQKLYLLQQKKFGKCGL